MRELLKLLNRQYTTLCKIKTMLNNNFISLVGQSFPSVNKLFSSIQRNAFKDMYYRWCNKNGFYSIEKRTL